MHLRRIHLQNVRSVKELVWELPDDANGPGWHVILGDNGSGKSTVLRAIALALIGPEEAPALRQAWKRWLRRGETEASVDLDVQPVLERTRRAGCRLVGVRIAQTPCATERSEGESIEITPSTRAAAHATARNSGNVWGPRSVGDWFNASYSLRRSADWDSAREESVDRNFRFARHLSLFRGGTALTEGPRWLQSLRFKQLEAPDSSESWLLDRVKTLINRPGFLPHEVRLQDVSSTGVTFLDGGGVEVLAQDLSDGYRSILSVTLKLVRQMAMWMTRPDPHLFSADGEQVQASATVLIDEIDAHLHPIWQRTIGHWFRRHFPNVQFIVTTHSPLICRAATVGSVFLLPRPGTDDRGEMLQGDQLQRLLYGADLELTP